MNTKTANGTNTTSPSVDRGIYNFDRREDWDKSPAFTEQMRQLFQKNPSERRFKEGDTALVVDAKNYKGFELLEEFQVEYVEGTWAYRKDGNCLPFSCLANVSMTKRQKRELEKAFKEAECEAARA